MHYFFVAAFCCYSDSDERFAAYSDFGNVANYASIDAILNGVSYGIAANDVNVNDGYDVNHDLILVSNLISWYLSY